MYDKNIEESLKLTNSQKSGLSQEQVIQRQAEGENVLPQKKQKSKILRFLQQFCDIMIIILLVASVISITIAIVEKSYSEMIDGFIILAIVFINAVLGFVQEIKAEKDMYAAFGWLAKEGKLAFEEIEGEMYVSLV